MMNVKPKKRKRQAKSRIVPILTSTIPDKIRGDDEPHRVGYARVSTGDQSLQRQVDELVLAGVAAVDVFSDVATGGNMDRPGWEACTKDLRIGDVLVLYSLDRLSRDNIDILTTMKELRERGVRVKILTLAVDSNTPIGRYMIANMAAFAEYERDMIRERTIHGLEKAHARGVFGGSKPKWTNEQVLAAMERANGNMEKARVFLGCSIVTMKRRMAAINKAKKDQPYGSEPEAT